MTGKLAKEAIQTLKVTTQVIKKHGGYDAFVQNNDGKYVVVRRPPIKLVSGAFGNLGVVIFDDRGSSSVIVLEVPKVGAVFQGGLAPNTTGFVAIASQEFK